MIENLWAGWRDTYLSSLPERARRDDKDVSQSKEDPSVFTSILRSGRPDEETYILRRSDHVFVILNAFPYAVGHSMVLPYRQVADLDELSVDESHDLWRMVTTLCRAVRREYRPQGINIGVNLGSASGGSVHEHLHVHVVPRWAGDTNFLAVTANTKTIPEPLDVTAARLRAALCDIESA